MKTRYSFKLSLFGLLVVLFCFGVVLRFAVSEQESLSLRAEKPVSPALSASNSSWGTFQPESWIQQKTTTLTLQDSKYVRSVTETRTELEMVDENGYALRQSVAVELNGKMVFGTPQITRYDFYRQPVDEEAVISQLPAETLTFGDVTLTCDVRSYEQTTPQWKRKTLIWYNPTIAPYILRTETIKTSVGTTEQPEEKVVTQTVSTVQHLPSFTLRGLIFGAYQVKTVHQSAEGMTVTISNCSQRIPGWIKSRVSHEYDTAGKLVRRIDTVSTSYFGRK
ncbi:MAG: hypothetical protein ACRC10_03380 [Thermoguttaceae bacterium]